MDSPVSAFAIYSKNKKYQHEINIDNKKKPKKKNAKTSNKKAFNNEKKSVPNSVLSVSNKNVNTKKTVPNSVVAKGVKKFKEDQKHNKEPKNIVKSKSPKRNKDKNTKKVETKVKNKQPGKTTKEKTVPKTLNKSKVPDNSFDTDSNDSPPILVPASIKNSNNGMDMDETFSKSSNESFEFVPVQTNSLEDGYNLFKWMIAPYNVEEFFQKIWERKPLHIARKKLFYYKNILTTPTIDDMLRKENIQFTKSIDITSYVDGKRETHNPVGRAHPHIVWDYYLNGCSIRLLNPQTYVPKLLLLNTTMQEFFNSFVGANAYLTPPDSQGFAPHYDDIEAFILQVEGKKQWKVYKPLSENEVLPRVSSKNFDQSEIGEPILEITLEAGDLLYFPRGYIHQGVTVDGEHSLHVTISMYQKHSWADLFEKMIPLALQQAITENVELRRGLPFDIYDNFGLVNSDINTPRKKEIAEQIRTMFSKIKDFLPIDVAVDEMAKVFQHDALPPVLNEMERVVTVFGDSDVMTDHGKIVNRVEIGLDTRIRLLRKNILRMVMEPEGVRLYYNVENSLEYRGNEPQFLDIDEGLAPAIETLIMSYPEYVFVENLDIPSETDKLQVANDLWEKGLIMTEFPLETLEDE